LQRNTWAGATQTWAGAAQTWVGVARNLGEPKGDNWAVAAQHLGGYSPKLGRV